MINDGSLRILRLDERSERTISRLCDVREYLDDRIFLIHRHLDMLRTANGASGGFSSVIGRLEAVLEQTAEAASKVMDDAVAFEAAAAVSVKTDLASALMGAVARNHKAAFPGNPRSKAEGRKI